MRSRARTVDGTALGDPVDFNRQIYDALRAAPWWMISIAFHVLVVVVSNAFAGDPVTVTKSSPMVATVAPVDVPPEEEPKDADDDEVERFNADDVKAVEPDVRDVPPADHDETDNDMPFEETMGEDSPTTGAFDGPSTNPLIGPGAGAGNPFGRPGRGGNRDLARGGPPRGKRADNAVEDALRWLAAHQSPDGGWACETWRTWCDRSPSSEGATLEGAGKPRYDVGVTGLALLAFLGAGYTNRSEGAFGKVVGDGLKYLRNVQDVEGCFGSRATQSYVYNHAIASLAMVEAYGMTGSSIFKSPTQKALDFIALARNPYFAWRYGIKPGDNDTSVTGWMMMALKSAKLINAADVKAGKSESLTYDVEAFEGIRAWVDKATDPDTGRAGYQVRGSGPARPSELVDRFPADKSESMTAAAMLARVFLGEDPRSSDMIKKGAELCSRLLPRWDTNDGSIDMYYWYYATLAMFQVGGESWKKWEAAMKPAIIDTQRADGDFCRYKGSWDPVDPWGADGGRVYSTACLALCLEVWYRYERVFTGTNGR